MKITICLTAIAFLFSGCAEETAFKMLPGYSEADNILQPKEKEPEYTTTTDRFSQNEAGNSVDIIWVIDNSGSMSDEQSEIAKNFDNFIDSFVESSTDFKMGITTTDTSGPDSVYKHNGEFLGRVPVLTSEMDTYEIEKNFMSTVKVGTYGSGRERGLEASCRALDRNEDPLSNNYEFIREDAFLAVIIVSDENDISPYSTLSYIDHIRTMKAKPEHVAVYSIVDTVAQSYVDPFISPIDFNLYCSGGWINPGGLRYISASQETGGFTEDIHGDFASSLLNIGAGIVELINSFRLKNIPIVESILVKVNGDEVEEDHENGWIYEDATNAIIFKGTEVPEAGATIEVTYTYEK